MPFAACQPPLNGSSPIWHRRHIHALCTETAVRGGAHFHITRLPGCCAPPVAAAPVVAISRSHLCSSAPLPPEQVTVLQATPALPSRFGFLRRSAQQSSPGAARAMAPGQQTASAPGSPGMPGSPMATQAPGMTQGQDPLRVRQATCVHAACPCPCPCTPSRRQECSCRAACRLPQTLPVWPRLAFQR